MLTRARLTLHSIELRVVSAPLRRPIVSNPVVTETADWLEWRDWSHPFLAAPFEVSDGMVTVPDRPGNGIEWDEAEVRRLQRA